MVFACYVTMRDHVIKALYGFLVRTVSERYNGNIMVLSLSHDLARSRDQRVLVVSYHPVNFGGHKHCGSVDLIFLVVEWQNSTYPHFHPQLLHIPKGHVLKAHGILY